MKSPNQGESLNHSDINTILEQRARKLAELPKKDLDAEDIFHALTFKIGEERYAVDIQRVREVHPLSRLSRVPCTPDFVIGTVNIRGHIYSVIDIVRFMGLSSVSLKESVYILLVRGENTHDKEPLETCIVSHNVPQVTRISPNKIQQPSTTISGDAQIYVRGVMDDMTIILDLSKILDDPRLVVDEETI
ncbi:CheW-like protein domain protein [Candidatus Magnetomorum sp. HK-1]|nr:CheW-like protein domain protein [Candidatus Magnetomorum sp. HK-1]